MLALGALTWLVGGGRVAAMLDHLRRESVGVNVEGFRV